ncbi:hypothetical protein Fmac_028306 [Flemingia macrophylla]|uniref:Uncharacterized protein n=1 Tax=Flemingia macrophylla TaxID=520843 RepID=A0ABD1L747_9FABA
MQQMVNNVALIAFHHLVPLLNQKDYLSLQKGYNTSVRDAASLNFMHWLTSQPELGFMKGRRPLPRRQQNHLGLPSPHRSSYAVEDQER